MAFQSVSGGVISALGTSLTYRSIAPHGMARTPKTLTWMSSPVKHKVHLGLKSKLSPSHVSSDTSYKRFSQYDPYVSRLNPFKDLGYFRNRTVLQNTLELTKPMIRNGRSFSTVNGDADTISITRNLESPSSYRLVVPTSNGQKCLFTLDNNTTVKSFLSMIQEEDSSAKNASVLSSDGVKIAGSTKLSEVLSGPFRLVVNNKIFNIVPSIGKAATSVPQQDVPESYQQLKQEIIPLYIQKVNLDKKSERQANWVVYAGLGYLVAQGALLARFTWWEFNWDIMEPVTYFVTFGTAILGYFYFTVTRREYTFSDIRESTLSSRMFKNYLRHNFPVERYYTLEHKLRSLDPEAMEKIDWEINNGMHDQEAKAANISIEKPAV